MQEEVTTFSSGAQSSSSKAGYWMIPFVVLRAVAQRFDLGAKKYDAHNWKRGCEDPEFMRDRFNHLFEHLMKFKEGGDHEDNMEGSIIAVLINAVFLTYWTIMHRQQVEAAFPTETPAVARAMAPLSILREAAQRINTVVPESEDLTPRRNAVAFKPEPRAPKPTPPAPAAAPPASNLPSQKPLPRDTGNSQFC